LAEAKFSSPDMGISRNGMRKAAPAVQNLVADRRAIRQPVPPAADDDDLVRPADAQKARQHEDDERQRDDPLADRLLLVHLP